MGTTTTMVDKTGTTTFQYDDLQRLLSTTDSNDKTVSYEYDILGRKTSITLPDGHKTSYEYDVVDRLSKVYDESETIAEYEYDANSQLISNVRNDIITTYNYNELGQIEILTTTQLHENIMQFEYEYDKIGNIVSEVRTEGDKTNNRTYTYDAADQLTEFTDNDYTEKYTYDIQGNLTVIVDNGVDKQYVYDRRGSIVVTISQDNIITSYAYTAYGDLMPSSPELQVFGFNGEQIDNVTGMQYLRARYYVTGIQRFMQEDDYWRIQKPHIYE